MPAPDPVRLRKLPIGLQNLRGIVTDGYCYVDKTLHALTLAEAGKYYFLSRPRRFGKSLFLDTLKELFEGNEPLFRGLSVHDRWDWSRRHPVIKLDFSAGILESRDELDRHIRYLLRDAARRLGLTCDPERDGIPEGYIYVIEIKVERGGTAPAPDQDAPPANRPWRKSRRAATTPSIAACRRGSCSRSAGVRSRGAQSGAGGLGGGLTGADRRRQP